MRRNMQQNLDSRVKIRILALTSNIIADTIPFLSQNSPRILIKNNTKKEINTMKKQKRFKSTWILWMVLLAIMPLLGACEKEEGMDENGIVSLSSIPKKPEYAKLPLIGTKWQLVGFANAKTGKVRKIKLYRHDNYILILEDRGKISGRTTGNVATGEYKLFAEDPNKISISGFGPL